MVHGQIGSFSSVAVTIAATGSGNLLVAFTGGGDHAVTIASVKDGALNAFTQFPGAAYSSAPTNPDWMGDCWYLYPSVSGQTVITSTFSGPMASGSEIFLLEIQGVTAPVRDAVAVQATAQTGVGSDDAGISVTAAGASDGICIGYITVANSVSTNPKTGNAFTSGGVIDATLGDAVCSLLAPSAAGHQPVWTDAGSGQFYQSMTVAFKEAGAAALSVLIGEPITGSSLIL